MRADEFITESKRLITEAKGHLDHPEDLVFLAGQDGINRAIQAIQQTSKEPENITVKWDGYPALIFGRDSEGRFTIMDKHMFNKRDPEARQLHSVEQWMAYERARGERQRSELIGIIQNIWPGLERATKSAKGYYWGDLLFRQPLQDQNGLYKFRANPNGIAYTVDVDSPLGQLITDKTAGIAVHQYLDPNAQSTDEARSLQGTIGALKNNSPVAIIPSSMPVAPRIVIPEGLLARAQQLASRYGDTIERFMSSAPQARNTFNNLFTTYINNKIVSGDLKNLVRDFSAWVASRSMTASMRAKIDNYLKQNAGAVRAVFQMWAALYNLKTSVVRQLDRASRTSPVKGYLSSGQQSQEGFVSSGLKFVNRLGFSRQNLAARQPAQTQSLSESVDGKQLLVIYPGGFHPFHLGHASVFDHLAKKFSDADVFVAATDTTTERPFEFKDKSFLANQSGVPNGRFVQVKSPYRSTEITQNYDPENTVLVFAVSEKDHDRISFKPKRDGSPSYFQPYSEGDLAPMNQHGYIYVVPKIDFKIAGEQVDSASKIRKMYAAADDQKKQQIIRDLYPHAKAPKRIRQILDRVLGGLTESRIRTKQQELSAIMEYKRLVDSGRVSMDEWMTLLEQHHVSKSLLKESRDRSLVSFIHDLESSAVSDPVVGKSYFPLPIHVIRDRVYAYDCDGHSPAKSAPKKCRLTDRSEDELTFMMSGRKQKWPLSLNRELSYATILCFPDYDSYEKAANLIMLKTGIELPVNKKLREADNPNYFGGSSQSAIPGTPPDLQPRPSAKKLRQQRREERALQRFMGH